MSGLALENISKFNYIELSCCDVYDAMKYVLFDALENETTFDMQDMKQIRLIESGFDSSFEKDAHIYPTIKILSSQVNFTSVYFQHVRLYKWT